MSERLHRDAHRHGARRRAGAIILAAALAIVAAAPGAALAAGGEPYELTVLAGSPAASSDVFRVNVATGQTWSHCCEGANTVLNPIAEAALPAGDYHLYPWSWFDPSGHKNWGVYRFDARSGRLWTITGGGDKPLVWLEIVAPH